MSVAAVAIAVSGTIPQLGFIHEDSGQAFVLDIADLLRDLDHGAVCLCRGEGQPKAARFQPLERITRRLTGRAIRRHGVVEKMIDRIEGLFDVGTVTPGTETEEGST